MSKPERSRHRRLSHMDVLVLTFLVACLRLLAAAAVPLTIASAVILPVIVVSEYREPLGRIFRTLRALVARWSHESTRRIASRRRSRTRRVTPARTPPAEA